MKRNLDFLIVFCLWQNWKRKFFEKQSLNQISGGGLLMMHVEWKEKLESFIDKINKMHPTIKFTADWSETLINFLDVTVSITEGITETDL